MAVKQLSDGNPDGTVMGQSATDLLGFYGVATPVAQRSGTVQAAIVTTATTQTSPFGFVTQAQGDKLVGLVNEIRATLVGNGMIKGS